MIVGGEYVVLIDKEESSGEIMPSVAFCILEEY